MTRRGWITYGLTAIALVLWWFYGADWVAKQGSYRLPVIYSLAVILTGALHLNALIRFIRMFRAVKVEEALGQIEPGATLFAANQRFRYAVRVVETLVVLAVAVVAFISVSDPKIAADHNYLRLVITYFIGSILVTGVLTLRDLQVINWARRRDAELHDRAIVVSAEKDHD